MFPTRLFVGKSLEGYAPEKQRNKPNEREMWDVWNNKYVPEKLSHCAACWEGSLSELEQDGGGAGARAGKTEDPGLS